MEDLQGNRNLPVYLLSELVKQLPDGVYINSMKQDNQTVQITGVAQSNERVSELLRNLANNSPWLTKPPGSPCPAGVPAVGGRLILPSGSGLIRLGPRPETRLGEGQIAGWATTRDALEQDEPVGLPAS